MPISPWDALGTPLPRLDGPQKVTGTATYAGDVALSGQLHAVLVQSTIARGSILRIDTAAAERLPGVVRVFTHRNLPALQPPPEEFTKSFPAERRAPLADEQIHYAGQHLALVLAETLEQAQEAASVVGVEMRAGVPALALSRELAGGYSPDHFATNADERLNSERGTPGADSAATVSPIYTTPVVTHNPMEPSACVVSWQGHALTVHDSTRWLQGEGRVLAAMLGVPIDSIRILSPFVGGCFGSKGFLWQHVALAAQAARVVGRPVKLVLTRQQMFTSTGHRPRTRQQLRFSASAEGQLTSLQHHTLTETSPVAHFVEPAGSTTKLLYASPHCAISHRVVPTNLATPCFMRAPGESPGMFALESALDELAHELKLDPLELRRRNNTQTDPSANGGAGRPFSSRHLLECYTAGAEAFGWSQRPVEPRSMRRGGKLVGWGMATAAYPARRSPCTVTATLGTDGLATFRTSAQVIGTGTSTAMAQIAAAGLGVPVSRIRMEFGDSAFPEAPVAGASQTTASVGGAVAEAAIRLREQAEGQGSGAASVTVHAELDPEVKRAYTFHSFGAHFCELEVDPDFGEVRVTRWVTALDCGRVLNPMGARSQVLGGVLFGIGMALLEQTNYDPRSGFPVNANLAEYLVVTAADTPQIDVHFIEHPDTLLDPAGSRGIGEIPICGVPGAIANAVFHATGRRVRDLPLTPERVLGLV